MSNTLTKDIGNILNNIGNGVIVKEKVIGIIDDDNYAVQKCIESLNLFLTTTKVSDKPILLLYNIERGPFSKDVTMISSLTDTVVPDDVILRILKDVCKDYGHVL